MSKRLFVNSQRDKMKSRLSQGVLVESSLGPWFTFDRARLSARIGKVFDQQFEAAIRGAAKDENSALSEDQIDRIAAELKGERVPLMTRYVAQELPHQFEALVANQIIVATLRVWSLREENGRIVGDKIPAKADIASDRQAVKDFLRHTQMATTDRYIHEEAIECSEALDKEIFGRGERVN